MSEGVFHQVTSITKSIDDCIMLMMMALCKMREGG